VYRLSPTQEEMISMAMMNARVKRVKSPRLKSPASQGEYQGAEGRGCI
jgi:hypothetical protein